jgi:hypothetical protein
MADIHNDQLRNIVESLMSSTNAFVEWHKDVDTSEMMNGMQYMLRAHWVLLCTILECDKNMDDIGKINMMHYLLEHHSIILNYTHKNNENYQKKKKKK